MNALYLEKATMEKALTTCYNGQVRNLDQVQNMKPNQRL